MDDVREQLNILTQNLSTLCLDGETYDKQKLHSLLDDLNAINYKQSFISDSNVVFSLIKTICNVVPPSETFMVSKSCKLIYRLGRKHQIPPTTSVLVCKFMIKALLVCNQSVYEDILDALYVILKPNATYVSEVYEDLIGKNGILLRFVRENENDMKHFCKENGDNRYYVELGALKCMQALSQSREGPQSVQGKSLTNEQLKKCVSISLFYLHRKREKNQDEINFCEILICVCNMLIQIYKSHNEMEKSLGELVGACRCWMLYGLEGCESLTPQKVMPSQQTVGEMPQNPPNKGGKRLKLRKHRNLRTVNSWTDNVAAENTFFDQSLVDLDSSVGYKAANLIASQPENIPFPQYTVTSESDMSDRENNRQEKLKAFQAKTRLAALNLLSVVIRASEKHLIFGYWWSLLPGEGVSSPYGLASCLQRDPSGSGRTAALTALLALLTACRVYLVQAEGSKHALTAFTPFSVVLGNTLEDLHSMLSGILSSERHIPVLVAALKCAVACIQATPYKKLGGSLLTGIIRNVKRLLTHRDWTIQVTSLIVTGCIISIDPLTKEITDMFFDKTLQEKSQQSCSVKQHKNNPNIPVDEDSDGLTDDEFDECCVVSDSLEDNKCLETEVIVVTAENLENMSWLVETCLVNLGWTFKDEVMKPSRLTLSPIRLESLQVMSAIALKDFESFLAPHFNIISRMLCSALRDPAHDIIIHATKCLNSVGEAMQKLDLSSSCLKLEDCIMFWTRMLRGPLTELLQSDQNGPARAVACDCISSIGESTFVRIPENLKLLCATLLLGSSADEEELLVRAAAIRALSVCIMYKDWREDPGLVSDCGESVLRVLNETSPGIKIKATWALANITDALLLNMENPETEPIEHSLLVRFLQQSISASKENDKIKMSAMRAIGNILFLLKEEDLKKNTKLNTLALAGIERLIYCASNGSNMKVRWNACHSLGKTMKNEILFTHLNKWQSSLFESLCNLMEKCRNLKVRSHAAVALKSPAKRCHYGEAFPLVWKSILSSMENANHIEDFTEYKHKDQLIEQLCVTLSHLACLLTVEDLGDILEFTSFLWDPASQLLRQVVQRTEPQGDTCTRLLEAAKYVTTQLSYQTDRQRECLNILQNLFIWET